jgi:predicted DNA-binding transcriptional regulator AlpA
VKVRSVVANNRRKAFEVRVGTSVLPFPYSKAEPPPTATDPVARVAVDEELDREGFVFELRSGASGTVHVEQVLEHNRDPSYLRDLLLYKLTLEAQRREADGLLSKREICRRLGTSASQLYRLLDQTNYGKSVDQVLRLLRVLDCDVDLVVRAKSA